MTKWNHGASYSISNLSEDEVKEAIDEWAEGSEGLKYLLTLCYLKGVNTFGCHFGIDPYIDFEGTDNLEQLKRMARSVSDLDGLQLLGSSQPVNLYTIITTGLRSHFSISDRNGKDPYSANKFFYRVATGLIDDAPENVAFDRVVDFYNFFAGKEPSLCFRLRQSKEDGYSFSIESKEDDFGIEYNDEIFTRAGLKRNKPFEDAPIIEWQIKTKDKKEFDKMMNDSFDYILREWNLRTPTVITDDMSFTMKTRIILRNFIEKPGGKKEFMRWFIENSPDSFWKLHRVKRPTLEELEGALKEREKRQGEER